MPKKQKSPLDSGDSATKTSRASHSDTQGKRKKGKRGASKVDIKQVSPEVEEADAEDVEGLTTAEKFGLSEWQVPCSYFFQQQGAMDFQSYLRLKREEKLAVEQYNSARKIQKTWRGFITRFKMRILHLAATKIQAFIRGFLARRRVGKMLKEKAERLHQKMRQEAATKIQAAWRGHHSRKTKLNFKEYKKIQEKNKALKKSIEKINKLEKALVPEDEKKTDPYNESPPETAVNDPKSRAPTALEEVEELLRTSLADLATDMSASRVAELYAYASSSDGGLDGDFGIKQPRGWDGKDIPPKRRSGKINVKKVRDVGTDSIDDLFPEFPQKDGLVKPDPAKVEALKQAIRLLRQRLMTKEERELQKVHYLLRTTIQPGIYSDIYCNELTEFEKQLKSVKYWSPPPDPRIKQKRKSTRISQPHDLISLYKEKGENRSSTVGPGRTTAKDGEFETFETDTDTTDTNATTGFEVNAEFDYVS